MIHFLASARPSHFGFYVHDLDLMKSFYVNKLGFIITDSWEFQASRMLFLSKDPKEHHQLVLATGRKANEASQFNQISFEVDSLKVLHENFATIQAIAHGEVMAMNHGGSWSVYFSDPENNPIEFFAYTHTYAPPIATIPIDMTQPFEKLVADTESLVEKFPECEAWKEWRERFSKIMSNFTAE
ncbi:glyoxalase [Synechococcus sp. KORDI-52]|uniref:VOC family protein n=1 Tax=Synechococcus sp. KORDI-52 TaxID=585425 RepID=UPI0004E08D6B|nr:VOC family protein [Synechococcus sp. KORDI-52]AII49045.1 glyoxalase [Synechococcus sp. KORDI-52]